MAHQKTIFSVGPHIKAKQLYIVMLLLLLLLLCITWDIQIWSKNATQGVASGNLFLQKSGRKRFVKGTVPGKSRQSVTFLQL